MLKKLLSTLIVVAAVVQVSIGQHQPSNSMQMTSPTPQNWCASDQINQEYIQTIVNRNNQISPTKVTNGFITKELPKITSFLPSPSSFGPGSGKAALRTIPIVVHVVHNTSNPAENVSDALIYDMLNILTETFRAQNANISNVRPIFQPDTADTHIEFCLASKDPSGAATTGITRTVTTEDWYDKDNGETNKMKDSGTGGKSGWPSTDYLNIWICNISNGAGFGVAGYAYLPTPGMHGSSIDGLVLDYDIGIGFGNTTATHEIGHYMGLNHTWGPSESCGNDDGFADTPDCGGPNYFCPTSANSCGTPNGDQIENFMDYADCAYMYTNDQSTYINNILSTTRSSLLASDGCEPVAPPVTDFSATPLQVVVNGSAQFTDLSTGIPDTWSWNISPGTHSYINGTNSSSQNPKVQFIATGFYAVTLTASNSLGSDDEVKVSYIEVITAPVCAGGIFCEDFSGGAIPAGWSTTSNAGSADIWEYSTAGPTGGFSIDPIASTTAGDGFMMFDSDALCSFDQNADLETPPINCGTSPGVFLEFEQYYRKFFDSTLVYVSNNAGATWDQYSLNNTMATNDATDNPELISIDISATAAFQANVIVKWTFWSPAGAYGGNEGCGYAWMIDDVLLREPPQYDANSIATLQEYSRVPYLQSNTIDLQVQIDNTGWDNITNVTAEVNVFDGVFTQVYSGTTNTLGAIATGTSAVLTGATGFAPTDTGVYYTEYIVSITETDGETSNDTLYNSFIVTDTIYSKDYLSTYDGSVGLVGSSIICLNKFKVQSTDYINSISAYLFPSVTPSSVGDNITLEVYNMAGGLPTGAPIASSASYAITPADTVNGQVFLTLAVNGGPVLLTPGDYAIGFSDQTTNGNIGIGLTTSNYTPNTAFIDIDGGGFNTLDSYSIFDSWIVRANFVSCDMVYNESSTQVSCGVCDGTASVAPTGAIAPYTYNWFTAPSQTAATATNLCDGTYQVVITDSRGCERGTTVQVVSAGGTILLSTSVTPENCGSGDGTATATASGGTGPYTFAWSGTTQNSATITGLAAGTFNVTATDAGGCTAETDFFSAAVVSDFIPTIVVAPTSTDEICVGANGTATGVSAGGTGPYTYFWDGAAGSQVTTTATGLATATYNVTSTDANGCVGSGSVAVANDPGTFLVNTSSTAETSPLANDGTASSILSGGAAPYSYIWSSGTGSPNISGLDAGTYCITVTDVNGCLSSSCTTVTTTPCAISLTDSSTDEICTGANGSANTVPSGGSAPYTYAWEAAAGAQSATSGTATGLAAASYGVTVTDGSLCTQVTSIVVNNNTGTFTVSNTCINTTSIGGNDGSSATIPSGGTGPYTYAWSPAPASGQNAATAAGLNAGSYAVIVTDGNGCISTDNCSVSDPICAITLIDSSTDEVCTASNGTATTIPTGGTAAYLYTWDVSAGAQSATSGTATGLPAATYGVTVTDGSLCTQSSTIVVGNDPSAFIVSNGCVNTTGVGAVDGSSTSTPSGGTAPYTYSWSPAPALGQTTSTASSLTAGSYSVTVTDGNGCISTDNCAVNDPGCAITIISSSTDATCTGADGTATAIPSGGSAPYIFTWAASAGAQSITSGTATALIAGSYNVTVTDGALCVQTDNIVVATNPGVFNVLNSCANTTAVGAFDGSSTTTPSGGIGPYTYSWSPSPALGQSAATASGLPAGTYSVTATDGNGCVANDNCVVNDPGCAITVTPSSTAATCSGSDGTVTASPSGGSAPYGYNWAASAGAQSITSGTATGLVAGIYAVTVVDISLCSQISAVTVSSNAGSFSTSNTCVNTTIVGASDGSSTTVPSGGIAPYTYSWSPAPASGQNSATASGLPVGSYSVTVTDSNGCVATDNCVVNSPGCAITVTPSSTASTCSGSDGTATASPSGGSAPYGYNWDPSAGAQSITSGTATGLVAGIYAVTVVDISLCSQIGSVTVSSSFGSLLASVSCSPTSGPGNTDGSATASSSGGSGSDGYIWDDALSQTTQTAIALAAGNYCVTITDSNGCVSSSCCSVSDPACALSITSSSISALCNVACDGSGTAIPAGGSAPYSYAWDATSGVQSTSSGTATGLCAGTYFVTVTDNSGCSITSSIIVTEPSALLVSYTKVDESCGGANGSATLQVSGGTTNYTYGWPSGTTSNVESNLSAGLYLATVTDFNGCMETISVLINDAGSVNASITPDTSICQGQAMLIIAAGGSSYTWNTGETTSFITISTGGIYACTVSNGGSCFDIVSTSISVNSIPTPSIVASGDTICPGYPVTLTAFGAQSYTWTPTLQTGATVVVYPSTSQPVYSVIGENNGCIGSPVQVQIYFYTPLPTAVASANTTNIPVGGSVNFDATGSVANTFSWDFDGNATTDGTSITGSYTYLAQGIYQAILTASLSTAQCSATDTITIYVGDVSLDELGLDNTLSLYPNPITSKLNISFELVKNDNVTIDVYNSIGKLVYSTELSDIRISNHEIDFTDNARGVYLINIQTSDNIVTKKVTLLR